jgi:hypothetical protein
MTRYSSSSSAGAENTGTMLGWLRFAADSTSRRNRSRNAGSYASAGAMTLSATGRSPRCFSSAR